MATRRLSNLQTLKPDTVATHARFQFSSTPGPMPGFSGSGFSGCYLSGTTYTLVANSAWPKVVGLTAQLALHPSFLGTPSGSLGVVFNGGQVQQLGRYSSGSVAPTGSGNPQTIDFSVVQASNGSAVTIPNISGSNWCLLQVTYVNSGFSRG